MRIGVIHARMGAQTRATLMEVEVLAEGDSAWWPVLCGQIAEEGLKAALRAKELHGWTWGGLWAWIVKDEKRYTEYMQALEAFAQLKQFERLEIVDEATPEDVAVSKLRSETRRDISGKIDRPRWGETVKVEKGGMGVVLDAGLVGLAGELLARLGRREKEKEVEGEMIREASNAAGLLAAAHMAANGEVNEGDEI